ncbi:hypothetical protein ACP70R_004841 [Stipagrostis hirtigluma subsp. patula]
MDGSYCESVIRSLEANLSEPPISTKLFLSGATSSREDIPVDSEALEENVLPNRAVAIILSYLPIKDVFRFGFKLSRTWLELWKRNPLVLHDVQLVPDHMKDKIMAGGIFRHNLAPEITHILDMHPGPVDYLRLEYTTWKGGNAQLRLWIEKLISKRVNDLVLYGRWPQEQMDLLPNNIIHCSRLRNLTLCFFQIPHLSTYDSLSFDELRELTVAHCELREPDVCLLLLKCEKLEMLSLGHIDNECMIISSESLSKVNLWNCRFDRLLIMHCPELATLVQVVEHESMHGTHIFIDGTPGIDFMAYYYHDQQTLYIDSTFIEDHPQYEALTVFCMGVKFIGNYQLDVIRDLLICFPNLLEFSITRMDPGERYFTAVIKWKDLIQGISCVKDKLETFSLRNSGLDDSEIDLAQSILMYAPKLRQFSVLAAVGTSDDRVEELQNAIESTTLASCSVIKLQLGTEPE